MAKTTRKTDAPGIEPKTRRVSRKPAAASGTGAAKTVSTRTKAPARTTKKTAAAAVAPATPVHAPTHDEIAERAYHIYLRRHGRPGNPEHDWLQAIEELRAERR